MLTWSQAEREGLAIVEVAEFWSNLGEEAILGILCLEASDYDEGMARVTRQTLEFWREFGLEGLGEWRLVWVESLRMWRRVEECPLVHTIGFAVCHACGRLALARGANQNKALQIRRDGWELLVGEEGEVDETGVRRVMGEYFDARCVGMMRMGREVMRRRENLMREEVQQA